MVEDVVVVVKGMLEDLYSFVSVCFFGLGDFATSDES